MKFERVTKYPDAQIPVRATSGSAGYDFFAADNYTIEPGRIVLVSTGVKCQLDKDKVLLLVVRSSTPKKTGLALINSVGIIDSDYYNCEANEGEIMAQLYNFTDKTVTVSKGDRIAQGVIAKYYTVNDDNVTDTRVGGLGSTSV